MAQPKDIEDVLSAIRRLVAEEETASRSAPGAPTLLLSAAQRVGTADPASRAAIGDAPREAAGAGAPQDASAAATADGRTARSRDDVKKADPGETGSGGPAHAAADPAAGGDRSGRPDILADEARLRALVADVLRQELSGDLGERITANIRDLVRREIRQILVPDAPDANAPARRVKS